MLGGLLERQLREGAEQQQRQQQQAEAVAIAEEVVSSDDTDFFASGRSNKIHNGYGSLSFGAGNAPEQQHHAADNDESYVSENYVEDECVDSDLEENYSYDGESEGYSNTDDGGESGDADANVSAIVDHNEESHLLHPSSVSRRRKRREGKEKHHSSKCKRTLGKFVSRIRAAIVVIADVDNVWDSPDAANQHRERMGAYADDPSLEENENLAATRSSLIYNAITGGTSTRNRAAALFWFIFLSTSYACERSTFKLLVDRVVPFRLFSAESILGCHALLTGMGMVIWSLPWNRKGNDKRNRDFDAIAEVGSLLDLPLVDVGLMAVLDTIYLLLGIISGAHVPPMLTVILVQTTIPLTACFTQCLHPDGRFSRGGTSTECEESSPIGNSSNTHSHSNVQIISSSTLDELQSMNEASYPDVSSIRNLPAPAPPPVKGWGGLSHFHILGTAIMFLAIFLGMIPAVLSLDHIIITKQDAMPERTAYNTIVFCLAAVPAAMSQLYKEHTLIRLRQPIDRNSLNMVLSIFQLLFAIVVSPLAYSLQGMGDGPGWTSLYPSKRVGENFSHGLACILGTLDDETMRNGYPETAECRWAWALVLLHVLSIIMVGVAIDKLAAATKVMYRGVSMGIMVAVLLMFVYQIRDQWCEYGPLVTFFHLMSTALLIVGAEIYHRVSLVDASFETVYPEIGDLYDDED